MKSNKKKNTKDNIAPHRASTIIFDGQDKPKSQKSRHYVDNKEFYKAMLERHTQVAHAKANDLPLPAITNEIGEYIMKVATGLSKKYNFASYYYKDEMIGDAIINCLKYIDNYDPEVTKNPFSYFTQGCYYAFISRIANEEKKTYIKFKKVIENQTLGYLANSEIGSHAMDNVDTTNDYMEEFIQKYEEKQKIKTNKQKSTVGSGLERFYE